MTEDDGVVQTIKKFRSEDTFDLVHHPLFHRLVAGVIIGLLETESRFVLDRFSTRVGRHDQNGVAEVDVAAERVGQAAFFHDLQQHVEDIGMSLFDFVEQHHGVGTAADLFGQLAAFFVADESGRGTDQAADIVLFHVLAHVDVNESIGVTEHVLGKRFGQQRLTDTGRSGKDEAAGGTLGILQPAAAAANRLGNRA